MPTLTPSIEGEVIPSGALSIEERLRALDFRRVVKTIHFDFEEGDLLNEARELHRGDRQFGDWLKREFPHKNRRTCTNLMNMAKVWPQDKRDRVLGLKTSHAIELMRCRDEQARENLLSVLVDSGENVSARGIRDAVNSSPAPLAPPPVPKSKGPGKPPSPVSKPPRAVTKWEDTNPSDVELSTIIQTEDEVDRMERLQESGLDETQAAYAFFGLEVPEKRHAKWLIHTIYRALAESSDDRVIGYTNTCYVAIKADMGNSD